jgi:hypothetical protein
MFNKYILVFDRPKIKIVVKKRRLTSSEFKLNKNICIMFPNTLNFAPQR